MAASSCEPNRRSAHAQDTGGWGGGQLVSEPDPSCGGGGKGLGTILHSSCPQVGMLT